VNLNAKTSFIDFWRFRSATHISKANCGDITRDRPVQLTYEIFWIKRSSYYFKFRPRAFKGTPVRGRQS